MPITVTVLDTAGIQPFIFASNVLKENVGASEIVHRATRLWAFEALLAELDKWGFADRHNINLEKAKADNVSEMYSGPFKVGKDPNETGAEVLYAGGGNTVILFQAPGTTDGEPDSCRLAKDFVNRLSMRLLQEAPGLNLYAAHSAYTWEADDALPLVVSETIRELGRIKGMDPGSQPALSWPVTAVCTSTGLPANASHPDLDGKTGSASRANRQVWAKWNLARDSITKDDARARLRGMFPWIEEARFEWTDDFECLANLAERGDSYLAVVHADGNGMGARINALTDKYSKRPKEPRKYIEKMRELSNRVQKTAHDALGRTLEALTGYLAANDWEEPRQHVYKDGNHYFPVRPIVFGGDDVTLVCAGPWGLAIAKRYLEELERETLNSEQDDKPYACAGVAIVKTHYPFSQAYHLSEQLIKSAKTRANKLAEKKASALDWYYTTTGLTGDLERMREREYHVATGALNMTPIMLHDEHTWRNWDNFTSLIDAFGTVGDWQEKRNKTLRLREALRGGPSAVEQFWAIYREKGEELPTIDTGNCLTLDYGWVMSSPDCEAEARCAYFDAIEIAEQFFELPPAEEE